MAISTSPTLTTERRAEFALRFRECIASYPFTPRGERLLATYAQEHTDAERRYGDLMALARRDGDITDAALRWLLPHADTPANRAADVWVSHAPTTASDPRAWLTRKGWVRAEEWPRVAAALLRFVRRAVDDPTHIAAACQEFNDLPDVRGFQMGMLAPILHALRPDAYCLLTVAARGVLRQLTGQPFTAKLTDFPAANAAAWAIIDESQDLFADPHAPRLAPSDLFDFVCHWLSHVKRWQPTAPRAWRLAAPDDDHWEEWRREGYIALGAPYPGDIADLTPAEYAERRTSLPAPAREAFTRLWTFAHEVREGDRVVVQQHRTALGSGIVTGPYYHVAGAHDAHRLPVQWERVGTQAVAQPMGRASLAKLDAVVAASIFTELPAPVAAPDGQGVREAPASYNLTPQAPARYDLARCAEETGLDLAQVERYARAITRKGQAILAGPPGMGKTYLAERLARALSADGGFGELVQFHPAYSYEDFIQGIRPQTLADGRLSYPLVPGRFMEFCARARDHAGRCVLVIDEINRANLAGVFGEVMALLEYRNRSIPLAGGGVFAIPANVSIIGTMNTADRSIALVDYALRRRFAFIELGPNYQTLRRFHARTGFAAAGLISVLQRVNAAIGDAHYALGISYFLRDDLAETLPDIWQMEVEPYLEELFFDRSGEMEAWRWGAVRGRIIPKPGASR